MMTDCRNRKSQAGVTILELMIGMVVGLIILSGALYVFTNTVISSRDILNSARMNQDLSAIMSIISGDLRRSGHWIQTASSATSPYTDLGMDLNVVSSSCVLYNYDEDNSGTIDNDEYGGFRFSSDAVWSRASGASMTSCAVVSESWNRLSDESFMTIDTATSSFTDNSLCLIDNVASVACPSAIGGSEVAGVREILISISASVNSDTDWQKTVTESVKIRNDFLQ